MSKRLIPPKTKVSSTIIKGVTLLDLVIFSIFIIAAALIVSSTLGMAFKWILAAITLLAGFSIVLQYGHYHRGYEWIGIIRRYVISQKKYTKEQTTNIVKCVIADDMVNLYGSYAKVIEVCPIEFILFKQSKQEHIGNLFSGALRSLRHCSIVKIEKPISYQEYVERYTQQLQEVQSKQEEFISKAQEQAKKDKKAFRKEDLNLKEFTSRIDILTKAISFLDYTSKGKKIKAEAFYVVIYGSKQQQLKDTEKECLANLANIGLQPRTLQTSEIHNFLNYLVYHEDRGEEFEMPAVEVKRNGIYFNGEKKNIATIGRFPVFAEGNYWASELMSVENTVAVININQANKEDVTKSINKTIRETRYRYISEKDESMKQDLQIQNEALLMLLQQFSLGNEEVHNCNFYIMYNDSEAQKVRKTYQGKGYVLNRLNFRQMEAFLSMLPVSEKELLPTFSRHIQSSTIGASFPFVNNLFMDKRGNYLGEFRYPVFWDIWERAPQNKNRVNSNLVVMGTSGKGKTFCQKKTIMQQRCQGTKVYVLDCEREYDHLASQMGGITINMSGGHLKINPFQVFPSFQPVEEESAVSKITTGDVTGQRTFLTEWFKSLLPLELNVRSMLNNCVKELYENFKINDDTDLSKKAAKDFPTFDDLHALIKEKMKKKGVDGYDVACLRELDNHLTSFSKGGIYAHLWNGTTTLDLSNDFIVFDFQQLFANSNTEVCNAQMMLLMRLLMREVIKIKDTNAATGKKQRCLVMIDEAHRYVSPQFPIALDTMEQFARRIRKYDGGLIVATQNISDFVGSTPEMQSKASAVINNCQYSMLFGLQADDINKVRELYKNYGGGLTEEELDFLVRAELGQMLFLVEAEKRSIVEVALLPDEKQYIEKQSTIG